MMPDVVNLTQDAQLQTALLRLRDGLQKIASSGCISIAYSGGLDSRFLAFFAARAGLTVDLLHAHSAHISQKETDEAIRRANDFGLAVRVIEPQLPTPQELARAGRERCYVCKRAIFSALLRAASAPLCDGSNASDAKVFRPGSRAIRELGVHTPLAEAGLTKPMIRQAAAALGLADPQQPARPCLLTRFDYGDEPDAKRLKLTQLAEDFLQTCPELKAGFRLRWQGQQALLHIASANALNLAQVHELTERLVRHFPALAGVSAEVLETLSGWFDRPKKT